jgi:sugar O-acyltransferase (sialic acid O-acetyltransferase NeuD family)
MADNKIIIVGASGQGKNISLLIEQISGWNILGFVDDDISKKGTYIRGYKVLGNLDETLEKYDTMNIAFAIGNSKVVEKFVKKLKSMNKQIIFPNLIHPSAVVGDIKIGEGNIINAGCVLTTELIIGNYNYFNRCCSVSHDVTIDDYCFIHSGVHLSGGSKVGKGVWFGVNSTIIQGLTIGDNVLIGAGAVVIKNVDKNAVMIGNPAKVLKYHN